MKEESDIRYDGNRHGDSCERDGKRMNKRTDEVLSLIASLDQGAQDYLNEYLANAPISILEKFEIVRMESQTTFIYEEKVIQKIFILVKGRVKATDQYLDGVSFEYMWFKPVKTFGAMEVLLGMDQFKTTLTTVADSCFLVISRDSFEGWMSHDEKALRLEAKTMGTYLLTQAKLARAFLFLEGRQRVMVFLSMTLELNGKPGMLRLSRQSIADNTGLSTRTVNRVMKELTAEGYLRCQGMRIFVNREQRTRLECETNAYWQGSGTWNRLL